MESSLLKRSRNAEKEEAMKKSEVADAPMEIAGSVFSIASASAEDKGSRVEMEGVRRWCLEYINKLLSAV